MILVSSCFTLFLVRVVFPNRFWKFTFLFCPFLFFRIILSRATVRRLTPFPLEKRLIDSMDFGKYTILEDRKGTKLEVIKVDEKTQTIVSGALVYKKVPGYLLLLGEDKYWIVFLRKEIVRVYNHLEEIPRLLRRFFTRMEETI